MIRKIQQLQKKCIQKAEQVAATDSMIQEKETLYVQLKNVLARQPGPEVAHTVVTYQSNLKEKRFR